MTVIDLERDSLEASFSNLTEYIRENFPSIQRVRYHRVDSDYILFQLSNDGIFWTDEFYYSEYVSIDSTIGKINYYLQYGILP